MKFKFQELDCYVLVLCLSLIEPSIEMSQEDQLTEQEDSRQRSIIANDEYRTKRGKSSNFQL